MTHLYKTILEYNIEHCIHKTKAHPESERSERKLRHYMESYYDLTGKNYVPRAVRKEIAREME